MNGRSEKCYTNLSVKIVCAWRFLKIWSKTGKWVFLSRIREWHMPYNLQFNLFSCNTSCLLQVFVESAICRAGEELIQGFGNGWFNSD